MLGLPKLSDLEQQVADYRHALESLSLQQQSIYRVIAKIRASLDTETIFCTATKETCRLLGVERVAVYRFNADWGGQFIQDFEFAEPGWEDLGSWKNSTVWTDSYFEEIRHGQYQAHQALYISDVYSAVLPQCHLKTLERFQIRAYATYPIFVGTHLWGILGAYQHSSAYHWKDSEIAFLAQIAIQLGLAVTQSNLLATAQEKAKALQQANSLQLLLLQLTAEIRESLELDVLFKTTVKEVRKIIGADRVGIFQLDPATQYHYGEFIAESVLPSYESAMLAKVRDNCFGDRYFQLYQQGRLQVLDNVRGSGLSDCHVRILERFQIQAQIIVPLLHQGKLWGLMCIHQCGRSRHWLTTEVDFVRQLAAQVSVALDHANLHAQVKDQAKRLVKMVSSLEHLNAKLTAIGNLDNLTQIPNRRAFDERLRQEWTAMKQQHRPLAVILIDIDFFKCFNDAFGHVEGDHCLRQVAQAIHGVADQWSGLAARYGGEEFAVILPQTGRDNAIAIIQEIRKKIQQLAIPAPDTIHRHSNVVTVSAGMASQIPTGDHLQSLVEAADIALYQAKAAGRDTWREFNPPGPSLKNHKPASVIRDDPANIKNPTTIKNPTPPNSATPPNSTTSINNPTNLNPSEHC